MKSLCGEPVSMWLPEKYKRNISSSKVNPSARRTIARQSIPCRYSWTATIRHISVTAGTMRTRTSSSNPVAGAAISSCGLSGGFRMDEVEALCDEICILKKGTPVFRGTVEQAKQQCGGERFEAAYLQLSDEKVDA